MIKTVSIPVSLEQEQLIAEHLFYGKQLYVSPDEKIRLAKWVHAKHPQFKIEKAEIDLENASWNLFLCSQNVTSSVNKSPTDDV